MTRTIEDIINDNLTKDPHFYDDPNATADSPTRSGIGGSTVTRIHDGIWERPIRCEECGDEDTLAVMQDKFGQVFVRTHGPGVKSDNWVAVKFK